MATDLDPPAGHATRRLVLVDFDWDDADLVPRLVRHPGSSVRLVAGTDPGDPGLRLAELCGLPRTTDLADLTREIFDLALVSERSRRRTQIEGLLLALGTPSVSPQSFLDSAGEDAATTPAVEAPLALHAAAFETALGGEAFDTIVEQALPDLVEEGPSHPQPVPVRESRGIVVTTLEDFPSAEDRRQLENALRETMRATGADHAELHLGTHDDLEMVIDVGPGDSLLKGLIALALELGTPQVVTSVTGTDEGRTWGAWPFRTAQRRGVLAAAGMGPASDWGAWQRTVEDLRGAWDREDKLRAGPAFPLLPDPHKSWLDREAFGARLELALERNRRDGMRFALHRLTFPHKVAAVDRLAEAMPAQLRDTDCICRPSPERILLLTAGSRDHFPHLRRRILAHWQEAWTSLGFERPIPGITDERVEMTNADDAEAFLARAGEWMETG